MSAIHYYLTFNPYLNMDYEPDYTQGHEFYDLLKNIILKDGKGSAYWGKFIANERQASVKMSDFQEVHKMNQSENLSTHLYISDFKNIWVGKVKSVLSELPKKGVTLPFYKGKKVEVWFELEDFILLEHNAQETANKLSELYIENDFSQKTIYGLSPFTTSVKYPCLVQDIAQEQYFDEVDDLGKNQLILKLNPAITKSNADQVLRNLHLYAFPEEMYAKLPHAAKLEIESSEVAMSEQRQHNMHSIAFSYLRALEIILNDLIINHIKRSGQGESFYVDATSSPPKLFLNPTKDYYITLKQFNKSFSISQLMNFMGRASNQSHLGFKKSFSEKKHFVRFVSKEFAAIVKDNHLVHIRNYLAHGESGKVSSRDANVVRNIILGCGTQGLLQMCYRTFYKEKFQGLYNINELEKNERTQNSEEVRKKAGKVKMKLVS